MIEPTTAVLRPATVADAERIAVLFTDEGYPGRDDRYRRAASSGSGPSSPRSSSPTSRARSWASSLIHLVPRFEHDDHVARVLALVVDAGARERGLGGQLMAEAERIGQEAGAAFIEVTAGHHRPDARRLYESLGYDAGVAAYLRKRL